MAVTQQRFLNSTVTSFTASIGWGETPSQVSISLVDDPAMNDSFDPGYVGRPCVFSFGDFSFTGIIQSFTDRISTGGYTHEVVLTDPREILEGTQLILDGYLGAVPIPNLLNIFGYLESFGFGSSQKNETGIPWKNIRYAIQQLTALSQQETYGGPIYFISSRYIVDLSLLPNVPEDYRIGGDSISILQFISEICEAGGCDYYISMVETFPGTFVIQPNTVSRTAFINYGAVTEFLASIPEYEDKSVGRELANETSSKFLAGGPLRELWCQPSDDSLNTVWQYWGLDINGNPNIGTGYGDDHQVVLDSRSVNNPRVGPWYITNVAEIRAVLSGRASWETFLMLQKGTGSIHTNKVVSLGIIGYTVNADGPGLFNEIFSNYTTHGEVKLDLIKTFFPHNKENMDTYDQLDRETGYLYDFLYAIATEYYGRKFMVNVPFTYSAKEPDTQKIRLSQLPVDSGFLDEELWPVGVSNNILPLEVDRFTEEDGKIVAFMRFDGGDLLDLSELNPESVAFNSVTPQYGYNKLAGYSVFVKCNVEPNLVFLDKNTRFGPRAILTLDGMIHKRVVQGEFPGRDVIIKFLNEGFTKQNIDITTDDYKKNVVNKVLGHIGQDILNYGSETSAVSPQLAVVPLESQTKFYGPWYATGTAGKTEYEQDESLVPWNYGGFTALDIAANSKVTNAIGVNLQLEQGDVTFPQFPSHNLGQALLAGGPLVSDISSTMGENGAHTTYKFRRNVKQPRYGQAKAERVAQLARTLQQQRRAIRLNGRNRKMPDLTKTKEPLRPITANTHPKNKKTSSHEMMVGQTYESNSGEVTSAVFIQADYNFTDHVKTDYENKAFMSLDGLFRPFATTPHSSLPYFKQSYSGNTPTVYDLNPFREDHDIKLIAYGSNIPTNLYAHAPIEDYRGMSLRGPVIVTGWSFDINGFPVPNASGDNGTSEMFDADYKTDMTKWKTGPIDLRWDNTRGVWAAGGGNSLIRATSTSFLPYSLTPVTGTASLVDGGSVTYTSWINQPICSGDKLFLSQDGGKYYAVISQFKPQQVVTSIICSGVSLITSTSTIYLPSAFTTRSGTWSC